MVNEKYIKNLAETAVKIGVNIQPDQYLVINSPIETAEFAREIAKSAFEAGAVDVFINYTDEKFSKIRLDSASKETLKEVPDWWTERLDDFIKKGAAVISISAIDPDLMKDVDAQKVQVSVQAKEEASKNYSDAMMGNKNRWCVISVPTKNWAKKVFPEARNGELATDLLWNAIIRSTHCNDINPIEKWHKKDDEFKNKSEWLNQKQFKKLHYKNNLGTDLYIGLPENHIWSGGSEIAQDGVRFFPNLPTEEIFTAPDKDKIDGKVVSTYPLVYHGKTIEDFTLEFKDGKIIDSCARKNEDILKSLIEIEGANSLGEVALVPQDSTISDMNILFYNTLFDENASCHLALGDAYPSCIEDGAQMSKEELSKHGLNQSPTHVDFMIGSDDMSISGIDENGNETEIFKNGNFVI